MIELYFANLGPFWYPIYLVPTITEVFGSFVGATNTTLSIDGDFFGPTRAVIDPLSDYAYVMGGPTNATCHITSVSNHTQLFCDVTSRLTVNSTYSVHLFIGGQMVQHNFVFRKYFLVAQINQLNIYERTNVVSFPEPCNPACVHGLCVGTDTCDCTGSGYEGDQCEIASTDDNHPFIH